jgi:hypothetical protein
MEWMNDYRVEAWLEDGLMKRIEASVRPVKARIVDAAKVFGLAAAAVSLSSSLISVPTASASSAWVSPSSLIGAEAKVDELARSIEAKIANFMSQDYSDVDESRLARARLAVEAMASRRRAHA